MLPNKVLLFTQDDYNILRKKVVGWPPFFMLFNMFIINILQNGIN
jgi:hypothetical protein